VSETGDIDAQLHELLADLRETLGPTLGAPVALDGGATNRNFRVRFAPPTGEGVLRLPGRDTGLLGIDRRSELLAGRLAARLGIGPRVLYGDERCLVTEYLSGAELDGDRLRATPEPVVRALRAFHDSGLELPAQFWIPDLLVEYAALLSRRGVSVDDRFRGTQELVDRIAAALPLREPVACHNDLLPGNLMSAGDDGDRPMLVDWEYAGMGHRWFDLGNLAVNNAFDLAAEDRLLSAYFDSEPPTAGRRAALALFKLVSDAREAAWGVVQGTLSELDFDFGAYADRHFTRLEAAASDQRRLRGWLSDATDALPELTPGAAANRHDDRIQP
jgi:thiamine kinase-like enzyme